MFPAFDVKQRLRMFHASLVMLQLFCFMLHSPVKTRHRIDDVFFKRTVPDIEACYYIDAFSVECWWRRPPGDNSTEYRSVVERTS